MLLNFSSLSTLIQRLHTYVYTSTRTHTHTLYTGGCHGRGTRPYGPSSLPSSKSLAVVAEGFLQAPGMKAASVQPGVGAAGQEGIRRKTGLCGQSQGWDTTDAHGCTTPTFNPQFQKKKKSVSPTDLALTLNLSHLEASWWQRRLGPETLCRAGPRRAWRPDPSWLQPGAPGLLRARISFSFLSFFCIPPPALAVSDQSQRRAQRPGKCHPPGADQRVGRSRSAGGWPQPGLGAAFPAPPPTAGTAWPRQF